MRPGYRFGIVLLLCLAAGCGQVPTEVASRPTVPLPPTDTPAPYPPPSPPPTPTSIPRPTQEMVPTPIVLGAEWAPESERETYVSTTVVVAPVGDGPGEVGYWERPEAGRIWADRFTVDAHGNIYILDKVNHRVAKFDIRGHVGDIPYPQEWYILELATDEKGMVYLYVQDNGVKLLDPSGKLLREYPFPSWLQGTIRAMRVDREGILWVEGESSYPSEPIVEGEPYPVVTVPLGTATESFDEERQKDEAKSGHLLFSGETVITHAITGEGPAFLYDQHGRRIYEVSMLEGVVGIDYRANLYTEEYRWRTGVIEFTKRLHKYDPAGRTVASFDLSTSAAEYVQTLVTAEGDVYCLLWNRDVKDAYRIVHWQPK